MTATLSALALALRYWRVSRELAAEIAEVRRLEAELQHSRKLQALGQFAGGFAHSLGNLLQPIVALAPLVARDLPEDSNSHRRVQAIARAADQASGVIHRVLAFSRRSEHGREVVDLSPLIEETWTLACAAVPSSIEVLRVDSAGPLGPALVNRESLVTAMLNVVANSVKALPDGGRITLHTNRVVLERSVGEAESRIPAGPYAELIVEDDGVGMEESVLARVFDPFFTTRAVGEGTGLGLSESRGLVEGTGGRLTISSTLGAGTRVRILLPLLSGESAPAHTGSR